jgi:DNA-directed RNA polymerase subunit beta'|uniref:DNA-directed RNA polymerase subunit n=1 Tax=Pseudochloris wilhelmii TaxID=1418016 RepID=A0A097KQT1_9CHLO|nr:beta' subunit of RNA polymerase [Pseudochloris wilhelmii]AIT95530.1 beta' subunit of RNA polymerase [Pseudochloris wilhelmii]
MKKKYFQNLQISVASPYQIRDWSRRPFAKGWVGEVKNWETVNYKTLKPELNGLFCQRIFGPIKDYTCACGIKITKKVDRRMTFPRCPKCGVEWCHSRVRRYRLGYIDMSQPVVHTLYALQRPISPLSVSLRWSLKHLRSIMYGTEFCFIPKHFYYKKSKYQFKSKLNKVETSNTIVTFSKPTIPRLFLTKRHEQDHLNKWSSTRESYPPMPYQHGLHTYGITFDTTWRQVEDLYNYFCYILKKATCITVSIPYDNYKRRPTYGISRIVKQHIQPYPLETSGSAIKKIFTNFPLSPIYNELLYRVRETQLYIAEAETMLQFFYAHLSLDVSSYEGRRRRRFFGKMGRLEKACSKRTQRSEYISYFRQGNTHPIWMVLDYIPVLPPGLRPLVSMNGEVVVSDINSLYRTLIIRNRRIFTPEFHTRVCRSVFNPILPATWNIWCYHLRHFQEATDALLKTGNIVAGTPIKSLLDGLKGKKGRFRQHLLGKRMDYSGRSVIVVGPSLQIHECGIPEQMAGELFLPFLVKAFRKNNVAITNSIAKQLVSRPNAKTWKLVEKIISQHPVLLNRAPTLHRLGIQAFFPKLVRGKAILLHPLVCPAFNADFDGDQMAVHVPLSVPARAEALTLLLARRQLLAPASGDPLLLPTQDMVLGCYYLTIIKPTPQLSAETKTRRSLTKSILPMFFTNWKQVYEAYMRQQITIHTTVWIRWSRSQSFQNLLNEQYAKTKDIALEYRLNANGMTETIFNDRYVIMKSTQNMDKKGFHFFESKQAVYIRTTPGRVILYNTFYKAAKPYLNP